ncbi:MAG: alanine/glycine:cation symporter family protein [Candidatus Chromulinivorax sp.]
MHFSDLKYSLDLITAYTFLATSIFLTCFLKFPQLRNLKRFFRILSSQQTQTSTKNTISPMQALLTAMSTSLGAGNIISPPLAIALGGPGALFWLVIYAFFGSVAKYTEVTFAVKYRSRAADRSILGGPTGYLHQVHPWLAIWYAALAMILFAGWSGMQAKTLAATYLRLGISEYITGFTLAFFVFYMLIGGAKKIGRFSEKLVPMMCSIYLMLALFILLQNIPLLWSMIKLVIINACRPAAAVGGFLGATISTALREGIFKSAFITEAGIGTAAYPHSLADTDNPTDQGILAMYSVAIDTFFCLISGFIALVSGVWMSGITSNTLMFDAFDITLPFVGSTVLIFTLTLFVIGTALGNSANGSKSFGFFTDNRFLICYYTFVASIIMLGAILPTNAVWTAIDFILPFVAIPNLLGIVYLSYKHRKELL